MGNHNISDDWMMVFRADCAEAIAHVEASKLPEFIKLAGDVVWIVSELIHLKAD